MQVPRALPAPGAARRLGRMRPVRLALIAVALLGSACSGTVMVREAFPTPLVERMPLRVAIHYPPALTDYVYSEDTRNDRAWTVQLGQANVRMFDSVFGGLFAETRQVSAVEAAATEMPGLDAIVAPAIDAFEFSLPSQSATDQFAVWIRYNLDVYGPDGQLIVRWPVTAYGQSGTGGLSAEDSMKRATVLALRDAAATIATGFPTQPKIRESLLKESTASGPPDGLASGPASDSPGGP